MNYRTANSKWIANMEYKKSDKFFCLREKNMHHFGKIYQGDRICKDDYIGKKEPNNTLR